MFGVVFNGLIGVGFGEDFRTNTEKTRVEKRLNYVFRFYYLLRTQ